MNLKINELEYHELLNEDKDLVILPTNLFDKNRDKYFYADNALSFYKFARETVGIKFFTEPEILLTQQSGEWFAPTLLITSEFITHNPAFSSILYGLITSYIYDILKANKNEKDINLRIICHETKEKKTTELHYHGDVDGLESITNAVVEIFRR
jgi:hypothetical protein